MVFVADSRPQQLAENVRSFDVLRQVMAPVTPPVGIVVQANKRDTPEVISLEALRDALGGETSLAMTEAVAERGDGVRETFVLAVRLALDRVRELWDRNALPKLSPGIDNGDQLFSAVQAAEKSEVAGVTSIGFGSQDRRSPLDAAAAKPQTSAPPRAAGPPLPEASVPPGLVWPPVDGRVVVHESARAATRLERSRNGDWIGSSRQWKLRSPVEGLFFDLEEARAALVDWARWHAAAGARLSGPRSIVVVPEPNDAWRLWQIVRRIPSLRDMARKLFTQDDDVALGEGLFRVFDLRPRAEKELVVSGWLGRLDLASVGESDEGEPLFTGFSAYPGDSSSTVAVREIDETRLFRKELGPFLRGELGLVPSRIPAVLASLQHTAVANHRHRVAESIQQVILGS